MQKEKVVNSRKNIRPTKILVYIAKANGRRIGTSELKVFLDCEGFDVDVRTIQRDLNLLEKNFSFLQKDNNKPQGWFITKDELKQLTDSLLKEVA